MVSKIVEKADNLSIKNKMFVKEKWVNPDNFLKYLK